MNSKIIKLINEYWRFDNDQDNLSTWHDKNDLIKEIEGINFTDSSTQLKENEIPTFQKWVIDNTKGQQSGLFNYKGEKLSYSELYDIYNKKFSINI